MAVESTNPGTKLCWWRNVFFAPNKLKMQKINFQPPKSFFPISIPYSKRNWWDINVLSWVYRRMAVEIANPGKNIADEEISFLAPHKLKTQKKKLFSLRKYVFPISIPYSNRNWWDINGLSWACRGWQWKAQTQGQNFADEEMFFGSLTHWRCKKNCSASKKFSSRLPFPVLQAVPQEDFLTHLFSSMSSCSRHALPCTASARSRPMRSCAPGRQSVLAQAKPCSPAEAEVTNSNSPGDTALSLSPTQIGPALT